VLHADSNFVPVNAIRLQPELGVIGMSDLEKEREDDFAERMNRLMGERFIDEKQLAERWSLERKTLQKYRYSGQGPTFYRIGGSVRYAMSDILSFEEASKEAISDDYS